MLQYVPGLVVVVVILLLVAIYIRRRVSSEPGLVGPLFRSELLRQTRGAMHSRLRPLLGFVLLLSLYLVYIAWFPDIPPLELLLEGDIELKTEERARFAEWCFYAVSMAQMIIIVLITPIFAANAIFDDLRRRTLGVLLTTDLRPHEIVLGKLVSRMTYVMGIIVAGLPILALMQLFGGVDFTLMGKVILLMIVTPIGLAGLTVWQAVRTGNMRHTLVWTYGLLLASGLVIAGYPVLAGMSSLITLHCLFFFQGGDASSVLGVIVLITSVISHLLMGVLGTRYAFRRLRTLLAIEQNQKGPQWDETPRRAPRPPRTRGRRTPTRPRLPPPATGEDDIPYAEAVGKEKLSGEYLKETRPAPEFDSEELEFDDLPPRRYRRRGRRPYPRRPREETSRPPVGDDALFWKEEYCEQSFVDESVRNLKYFFWKELKPLTLFALGCFTMVLLLIIVGTLRTGDYPAFINGLVRGIGILFLVGGILSVGLHAASTVAREREERTLDGLRTLPISQQEILWAKLRASLRRGRWCVIPLGFTLILGGIVVGIGLGLLPLVIVYSATLLVVAGTFGLWLSVRCHTVSRAMLYFMFTLTAFSILPPIIASLVGDAIKDRPGSVRREMIEAASPMLTWWRLTANESERTRYQDGFEGVDLFPMTKARFLSVTGAIVALWVVSLIFWGHSQRLLAKQE